MIAGAAKPGAIVIVRVFGPAEPAALLAPRTTVNSPGAVATPEIAPVVPFTPRPVGRPVAVNAVGVLVAAMV